MNPENNPGTSNNGRTPLRLLRPSILVLCGPAACGKSTFAQRHFRPTQIISSDWARALICDDERDQRFNGQAFALVNFLVEQRLAVNRLCVVDSTALTAGARRELLDIAKKYQVPTTLMIFNVQLETCIERDQQRQRSIGSSVIERQFQAFEQSKEAVRLEGFDQIIELRNGDSEKVEIEILFRPVTRLGQRPQRPEKAEARRSERSIQSAVPRPNAPGNNGRQNMEGLLATPTHAAAPPRAVVPSAIPVAAVAAPPHPVAVAAAIPMQAQVSPSAPAPVPNRKPNMPQGGAVPKAASHSASPHVPVGVES